MLPFKIFSTLLHFETFLSHCAGPGGDGDTCQIDLEERTGKYPPFILRNSDELVYPEGSRILKFGIY